MEIIPSGRAGFRSRANDLLSQLMTMLRQCLIALNPQP